MKSLVWVLLILWTLTPIAYAKNSSSSLSGKRLYRSYCLVCHGEGGKGNGPLAKKLDYRPADLSSEKYRGKAPEELVAVIAGYGRKEGSRMPNWGTALDEANLRDISAYVTDILSKDIEAKGDARRGRAIFKGACIACHGENGNGNGVLANLIDIPMIDQTDADRMEDISDEELIDAVRDGKGHYMASWKGTLSNSEIVDVVAYVRVLPSVAAKKSVEYVPDLLEGRRLYRSYCLVCHGVDGKSVGPLARKLDLEPADLSAEKYQTKTIEVLAATIEGYARKAESKMPNWGAALLNTDLRDVAAYLTKLTLKDLSYEGDARRGRAIFKGACVACHGEYGTGKGVLAQLIQIPIIDFTESEKMTQISDQELIHSIREGKGAFMAAWKETFSENEIIDVASYVRSLAR